MRTSPSSQGVSVRSFSVYGLRSNISASHTKYVLGPRRSNPLTCPSSIVRPSHPDVAPSMFRTPYVVDRRSRSLQEAKGTPRSLPQGPGSRVEARRLHAAPCSEREHRHHGLSRRVRLRLPSRRHLDIHIHLASHPERPNEPSFRPSPIHVRTRNRCASLRADHHHVVLDARALVRLQSDHINRTLVPAFYRYLQAQDPAAQISSGNEFRAAIDTLVALFERADKEVSGTGLWNERGQLGWADIMVGPCESCFELSTDDLRLMMSTCVRARSNYLIGMFRANNVLKRYRGFEMPEGAKFNAWLNRLFEHPAFKSTCSTDELYLDSYERRARSRSSVFTHLAHSPYRYAFSRPNTSQVANAINSGKGLP